MMSVPNALIPLILYNEKCAEENDSMNMKNVSTLTAVVGEEIEAFVKQSEILRRSLAVCESSVTYDDNYKDLLHTSCLWHVLTFLGLL